VGVALDLTVCTRFMVVANVYVHSEM